MMRYLAVLVFALIAVLSCMWYLNSYREPEVQHIGYATAKDEFKAFTIAVRAWQDTARFAGFDYQEPRFVSKTDVKSKCYAYSEALNPFYCPADRTAYVSPKFKSYLERRGAKGNMALHLVIHHEVAHDLQHQLGLLRKKQRGNKGDSRLIENMADCLAGYSMFYSHKKKNYMRQLSDTAEVVLALNAVGCRHSNCSHGSPEKRIKWFYEGFHKDGLQRCTAALNVQHIKE